MNILFLMGNYPGFGGVEIVSAILANRFIKENYGVSIVSFVQPVLEKEPSKLDEKVKFHPLRNPVYSKDNVRKLHNILIEDDIDVIINQWVVPYYVARLCSKAMKGTKCKMIGVHHNAPNFNYQIEQVRIAIRNHQGNTILNKLKLFLVTLVSRLSLRYTISKCTKYLTLSPGFIPIAEQYAWMKNNGKFEALANPLTIEPYNGESLHKENEIIYVGRIEYNQKCTYRIVDIWEKLEKKHPDWCLKIVGDGPDGEDLQKRIDDKGLKNICIEGFRNPLSYYKEAKLLILASAYEGFALVLVESMEYGVVPFVYDSFVAVHDIIDDGINGFIVPQPYSDEAFVARIENVMQDEEKRCLFSKAAMVKAKEFSLGSIVGKWKNLFHRL